MVMQNLDKRKSGRPFLDVFVRCAQGLGSGKLITRESRQDKEFHFHNWFKARLSETGLNFAGQRRLQFEFGQPVEILGWEFFQIEADVTAERHLHDLILSRPELVSEEGGGEDERPTALPVH